MPADKQHSLQSSRTGSTSTVPRSPLRVTADLCVCCCLFGGVLKLISLIATDWARPLEHQNGRDVVRIGLWKYCDEHPEDMTTWTCFRIGTREPISDWFTASQAMFTVSFILHAITNLLFAAYFCSKTLHSRRVVYVFGVTSLLSAVCSAAGLLVYANHIGRVTSFGDGDFGKLGLSWCFWVEVGALFLSLLSLVLAGISILSLSQKEEDDDVTFENPLHNFTIRPPNHLAVHDICESNQPPTALY